MCAAALAATRAEGDLAPEGQHTTASTTAPTGDFDAKITPLLRQYCFECHGDGVSRGDLELDTFKTVADMRLGKPAWQKVIQYIRTQTMPPPTADQPTQDERDTLVEAIQRDLYQIDPNNPDPGRVTIRRLNRAEYRNTIRDLVGVQFDPTIDFPQDDTGYGFDNIADVLTLPPMLMEKYLAAAERILDEAIPTERLEHQERRVAASDAKPSFTLTPDRVRDGWVALASVQEDSLSIAGESPGPAEYVVRVLAYATHDDPPPVGDVDPKPLKLSLMLGDVVARDIDVLADATAPQWYEARVGVPAGRYALRAAMRRKRGPVEDEHFSDGRYGLPQKGQVHIKEIIVAGPVSGALRRVSADRMQLTGSAQRQRESVSLTRTNDEAIAEIDLPTAGHYLVRVQAYGQYAGDEPAKMEVLLDDQRLGVFDVAAPARMRRPAQQGELAPNAGRSVPMLYELKAPLPAGKHQLAARYLNNLVEPENPDPNYRDRNLYVQSFEIVELSAAPLSQPMSEPMRNLFASHAIDEVKGESTKDEAASEGVAAARALLTEFARRAWRRPLEQSEIDRLMKLHDLAQSLGEPPRGSVKHAMKAVLVSSSFLFRDESQAAPGDAAKLAQPVGEYDLASRLSYFLWSSTPDDELLALAAKGELRANLDAQVKRMLASPKSEAFVDNFAGQWLQFRNLDAAHPDEKMFKAYNDRMRDAMKTETRLFFTHIMREDRSLMDVLTADYTFVNASLAKHYGLPEPKGEGFQKVSLAGTQRRGVLTQGSVLTLTSTPTRTSPVKRGKWVLENLLGTTPPPPPPDIPSLESDGKEMTGTIRQRLEAHRSNRACASCHAPLDPIGFGLENFDAIGAWRDQDGKDPVDAASAFASGEKFNGPVELAELLAKTRKKDFYRAVTEAALTFALGRGVEPFDQPAVDTIIGRLNETDGKLSALIFGVVNSVPFQMQRAQPVDAAQAEIGGITTDVVADETIAAGR